MTVIHHCDNLHTELGSVFSEHLWPVATVLSWNVYANRESTFLTAFLSQLLPFRP